MTAVSVKLPRLSIYVLGQLIGPTALFAFLMTAVVWLTQSLRLLDLVINRGQSAPTFVYLTILILPSLLVIILPIAFFAGTLYSLTKLNTDSELVVMASAGYSRAQLAAPVMIAAGIVMALTYLCGLYLMPAGQRAMKDKVLDIRADVGAALLERGRVQHAGARASPFSSANSIPTGISAACWFMTAATRSIRSPIWRRAASLHRRRPARD